MVALTDQIHLVRDASPYLRHVARPPDLSRTERERIGQCIEAMKHTPTPDTGARKARVALREKGHKFRNDIIAAAVKARKIAATEELF